MPKQAHSGSLSSEEAQDWAHLEELFSQAVATEVTEIDLQRLRRRVRHEIEAGEHRSWSRRLAVVAAAAAMVAFGLFAALDARRAMTPSEEPNFSVLRAANGGVLIRFHDGAGTHRINRSLEASSNAEAHLQTAGRSFVDDAGEIKPGQVVFYRID